MRQVPSHRRCIRQENILHFHFTEYSAALSIKYLIDNISECPAIQLNVTLITSLYFPLFRWKCAGEALLRSYLMEAESFSAGS